MGILDKIDHTNTSFAYKADEDILKIIAKFETCVVPLMMYVNATHERLGKKNVYSDLVLENSTNRQALEASKEYLDNFLRPYSHADDKTKNERTSLRKIERLQLFITTTLDAKRSEKNDLLESLFHMYFPMPAEAMKSTSKPNLYL